MTMRATGPCTRRLETVHLAALGVWFGALVTVSATAALAFPTMKRLQPALPGFRIDLADHPQIAAGHVMNPAFMGVMVGGAVCSLLVALGWPSFGAWRRGLCGILMLLAVGTLVGLGLPMREHLGVYWEAAAAGELEAAAIAKEAFDALHRWSSRMLGGQAVLVLAMLIAGIWQRGSGRSA